MFVLPAMPFFYCTAAKTISATDKSETGAPNARLPLPEKQHVQHRNIEKYHCRKVCKEILQIWCQKGTEIKVYFIPV